MIKRNGSTFRTLLMAVVLVALIYFIYLYNGVQSRLRNSEIMSEKLKRDRESLSSQLNDISLEKESIKEKYQKERLEIMSKLSDVQNKYKMLQSQHQDMETEYTRIQQKLDKFSEDSKQKDVNRNQEFMQLKQEKEMEVVKLKDQNANLFRESEQYKAEVINLKQQLQQQQLETYEGWNQVGHLKKAVEHLQLSLQREKSESESLRQQLQLAKTMNMKNMINNQMDTGGGLGAGNLHFVQHQPQPVQQQQQQQQQPVQQQQQQQMLQQPQGVLNDVQNGNAMGRILHHPPNNQFGLGQQQAQMPNAGILDGAQHGLPVKREVPVEQQNFQIQPADVDHEAAGILKADNGQDLALQKQEVEQRKQQNENEHNQVQPPINNEQLEPVIVNLQQRLRRKQQLLQRKQQLLQQQRLQEPEELLELEQEQLLQQQQQGLLDDFENGNAMGRILHQPPDNQFGLEQQQVKRNSLNENDNKNELDEEEAEREHIFGMLNRHRHAKRNEPFEAEHPIAQPAFQGEGKAINGPQVNVEDKLAGRDSANENHQFFEEKVPQEMMGQNLEENKDGSDQVKKGHKGNKRQKLNRNHAFDNVLLGDEKELQVQHPNSLDGGNKKSQGLNNDDQYYDEEEDDTYQ